MVNKIWVCKIKRLVVFLLIIFQLSITVPALASHGYYNSRVVVQGGLLKYMEGNSWYWSAFPYMKVTNYHYYDGWNDALAYGNWRIARVHVAHWHYAVYGRSKSTHKFYNHGYWYYRYSSTSWVW